MRATALTLACVLGLSASPALGGDSLSFSAGRALSAERGDILLVLVHGSDWNLFGERVFENVWKDSQFSRTMGSGIVLADVDILQAPGEDARLANDERNAGWTKKGSGLVTYPAVLAYAPDGARLGERQGRELPRELEDARRTLLDFGACCREWKMFGDALAAARKAGDSTRELELLIARDRLPLQRSPNLLEELQRLDPEDASGHHARLSFPYWNTLVKQATDEAKAGKGSEAEQRLLSMLDNPAYTPEQRGVIHLALGSAYRRWEGHQEQAGASFRAAWRAAPESICGRAGMRLYLRSHGDPSLEYGWGDRHSAPGKSTWTIEDLPGSLEPGTYRLRLERTHGGDLSIAGVRILVAGQPDIKHPRSATLTKSKPTRDFQFTISEQLSPVTLILDLERSAVSRGTIGWTRLEPE